MRDAVQLEGYYKDGRTADRFYQAIYNEIEIAFKNGKLRQQATMPSALMPPWQSGMLSSLLSTIAQADAYVSSENELFLLRVFDVAQTEQDAALDCKAGT